MSEHDLVVRGGVVVDGTGAPRRRADVAVSGGVVTEVGKVAGRGAREIDADGAVVAPGFVDIHTHYDGQATWDERLQPSSWHGVTTAVASNCGVGFAPAVKKDHDRLIDLMEGIEDIPGTALHEGLAWNWESFEDYLDVLETRNRDMDLAVQVPHAALRVHVMGERAVVGEPATAAEAAEMARLARAAIEAGALGFTTSRTLNHKSVTGELTPVYDAGVDELAAIAAEIGKTGKGVFQLVADFIDIDADFDAMYAMLRASRRPLSVSLNQFPLKPDAYREVLRRIAIANGEGHVMRAQVAARGIGLVMGLQCTLHPFMTNPVWQELSTLPFAEQAAMMAKPEVKSAILAAQTKEKNRNLIGGRLIDKYHLMYELTNPPNYEPDPADSVAAIAARAGRDEIEVAYDILVGDGGQGLIYVFTSNFVDGTLDAALEMLRDPNTVPGLSDGGAHVGSICDGSFPTTLLQHWVRERDGERLELEYVIQQQARDTARTVGLLDRGVLAPGYKADLNVIDMDRVRTYRPELLFDLPAGGRRLVQRADGYLHTVVGGVETYRDGVDTGELPGRVIRGPQASPAA